MTRIFIDLDGTLADDRHRKHFAFAKEWAKYFAPHEMLRDTLWQEGADLVDDLIKTHGVEKLAYLTGRREDTRGVSLEWLAKYGFPTHIPLHMKPLEGLSWTPQYKVEVLLEAKLIYPKEAVVLFDDDPAVVAHVTKELGSTFVVHCTWNPPWAEVSA